MRRLQLTLPICLVLVLLLVPALEAAETEPAAQASAASPKADAKPSEPTAQDANQDAKSPEEEEAATAQDSGQAQTATGAAASALPSGTPAEKGLAIAQEADNRDTGFVDSTVNMKMILRNRHGQESVRKIRIRTLEVTADGDKSLLIFDDPKDVKGTAFLTFAHKVADDDQWLFLPALKRVKRISSRNKSGSFMGSEFAYEDIANAEVEKYTYTWLRDEEFAGHACYVVAQYPVDRKNSGYTRQISWIDKAEYRRFKTEYYDRKDSLLKTLAMKGYKKYQDAYWRSDEMEMINHLTGKSTRLEFADYKFGVGLKEHDFSTNSLRRAK